MYRISYILAVWLLLFGSSQAFTSAPVWRRAPMTVWQSSAPSDSAELDDTEEYSGYGASSSAATLTEDRFAPPTSDLLNLLSQRPLVASEPDRARINELIVQMEQAGSSNQRSTSSPLLNGVWELKYVGGYSMDGAIASPTRQIALFLYSGGYSPGVR
jgi:PAP_fibrillin